MSETTDKKSHKEIRKEYTLNKLTGLGQEIIEKIEEKKVPSSKKVLCIRRQIR